MYWVNLDDKNFVEIRNLSGFVLFELLVKHLLSSNDGEFQTNYTIYLIKKILI